MSDDDQRPAHVDRMREAAAEPAADTASHARLLAHARVHTVSGPTWAAALRQLADACEDMSRRVTLVACSGAVDEYGDGVSLFMITEDMPHL